MTNESTRALRIFTWHVHGSYLFYLAQCGHQLILPVKPERPEGFGGRTGRFDWPDNVKEVPAEEVPGLDFDCVLFQSRKNFQQDRFEVLSEQQRALPCIYLEHDPPREHPTNTRHPAAGHDLLLVHVTPYNDLMWDNGTTPTRVIEHGVTVPQGLRYIGDLEKGIVVVNNLAARGRRVGADLFELARREVYLDVAGMGSEALRGIGDLPRDHLLGLESRYRFFFNPIRYTSLGLSVCEAMMIGLPVVAVATTEMPTVVENGVSGYVDTRLDVLVEHMRRLIDDPDLAHRLSDGAKATATRRFNIERFANDWREAFAVVTGTRPAALGAAPRGGGHGR